MSVQVMVVTESPAKVAEVQAALTPPEYVVMERMVEIGQLSRHAQNMMPDVVVLDLEALEQASIDQISELNQKMPRPMVLFTRTQESGLVERAIESGIDTYINDQIIPQRLPAIIEVTMVRFNKFQKVQSELDQAKAKLNERKLIERAKGILMKQKGCCEEDAYKALRTMAMKNNKRMVEVAESVIATAELFI